MWQATVNDEFSVAGIGVHSGKLCCVTIRPALENSGILFVRSGEKFPADYRKVTSAIMSTRLSFEDGSSISTIEHLMAALYGCGISNALIETDDNEIPILDGSAKIFVEKVSEVGIKIQSVPRKILKILKTITVEDGEKKAIFSPAENFTIEMECDFTAKGLAMEKGSFSFRLDDAKILYGDILRSEFAKKIAPARTFGFMSDVEYLKKNNLALGASLDNSVVFDASGQPINEEGLRFFNEPVSHKILDALGDLSLSGYQIQGKYSAYCSGHKLNNMALHVLFSDPDNYMIFE